MTTRVRAGWALLLVGLATAPACVVAAAGAGAGAGVYLTSRGAESQVDNSIDRVAARTQAVFREMKIEETGSSTEHGGAEREFHGKKDDLEVTVKLERKGPGSTNVEVSARKNIAEWDKDFAKRVLAKIAGGKE